jgi:hypothetical protein
MSKNFSNIIPSLITEAQTSTINHQLAAVVVKGTKMIGKPCANSERNSCMGQQCGSLHAEAKAILIHFGKDMFFSEKNGWCYQPREGKKRKGKEVGYYRY